jgi:predicted DNA-binding antitoxin AbrB/MazE fold protein
VQKKKLLGMIDFRGCEVRVRIATHKSVEKAKKMANGKSAEKANKKLRFAFEIVQPANKPIFLRETVTSPPPSLCWVRWCACVCGDVRACAVC